MKRMQLTEYRRSRPARVAALFLTAWISVGAIPGLPVLAQVPRSARGPKNQPVPVLIEVSAPIANLIDKADDGIARRDWKFAIDSLQRVIDDRERSLVVRPDTKASLGKLYESVRNVAMSRLSRLPPDAVSAYRVLYDGKAKSMYERALRRHDTDLLRELVDRYLLTSIGDQASDLLASWLLDDGRPADALSVLNDVKTHLHDADVSPRDLAVKRAAALMLLNRTTEAKYALKHIAPVAGTRDPSVVLDALDSPAARTIGFAELEIASNSWSVEGGSAARAGRMTPVSPTLQGAIPWRYELDAEDENYWRPLVTDDPTGPLVQPPGKLAAQNGLLFVRTPERCSALDLDTLAEKWSTPFRARSMKDPTESPSNTTITRAELDNDYAAWSVSAGLGKVFALQRWTRRGTGSGRPNIRLVNTYHTWLTAFDQETGAKVWQAARNEAFPHPLADAEIRALPIVVNGRLWVPYQRQRDLHLACLDAETGEVIRTLLLCTLPTAGTPVWQPLSLAHADGTIYVSVGEGVLVAARASDGVLLWANEFGESVSNPADPVRERPPNRLVSAPIVARGRVFVAPVESDELVVFAADRGSILWRRPLNGASYLVGVDDGLVFLGGRVIAAHSLVNGERLWEHTVSGAPTGRTVLSGDTLYTPTWDGLLAIDSANGESRGFEALPSNQTPLGTLLCINNAMYSLDTDVVRKFPDVRRAYPDAMADFEANPGLIEPAVRLAWMELLSERPDRAYDVIRTVDEAARDASDRDKMDVARVRVASLLELARRAPKDDPSSLELVEEADAIAISREQRIEARLAFGERLIDLGRADEAYRKWVMLGTGPEGDALYATGGRVRAPARLDLSHRLQRLRDVLTPEQRESIAEEINRRVAELSENLLSEQSVRSSVLELHALIELNPVGQGPIEAMLSLADLRMRQRRYEQAEQLVLECYRRSETEPQKITALLRLYETIAGVSEIPGTAQLALLTRLKREYGSQLVPGTADYSLTDWVADERARVSEYMPAEDEGISQAIDGFTGSVAWSPVLSRSTSGRRMGGRPWTGSANCDALVKFGGDNLSMLGDRLLLISSSDTVQCLHAGDGRTLWESEIGFVREPPRSQVRYNSWEKGGVVTGMVSGQTGVFRGATGLHALGLVSGKRIWSVRYDGLSSMMGGHRENIALAAGDGWFVGTPKAGRLTSYSMLDGGMIWERDLRGEFIYRVEVVDDRIITFDEYNQRVHVIDPSSGELLSRQIFKQPDIEGDLINVIVNAGVITGPARIGEDDGVVAFDLETGEQLWQLATDKPLTQLFKAGEGLVGIGGLGGELKVANAATGELVFDGRIRSVQRVVDAIWDDDVFVIRHVSPAVRSSALVAIDPGSGEVKWDRGGLATMAAARYELQKYNGWLPVLVDQRSNRGRVQPLQAVMLDVQTGEEVGDRVDLMYAPKRNYRLVVMQHFPNCIVFGTPDAVIPFEVGKTGARDGDG
ncbi:MAG: outer membrane protein assembly factor BamB family protein [Planctomycetota bacterium]|jgi:outer membrane protein assembly factor BamB